MMQEPIEKEGLTIQTAGGQTRCIDGIDGEQVQGEWTQFTRISWHSPDFSSVRRSSCTIRQWRIATKGGTVIDDGSDFEPWD
tara:strand:+ start:491 stop:736 length:246 start_codon:yes stop_codon:yes gene_type:complete